MAFDVSYIFQAIDKFTRPARDILRSTKRMQAAFDRLNKIARYGAELQQRNMYMMFGMSAALYGVTKSVLGTASSFQQLNMTLHALTKHPKQATWLFHQAQKAAQGFGADTTLAIGNAYAILLAVGVQAKNIPKEVNRLLDISALSINSLTSLATATAKVFGTGRVTRKEIRLLLQSTTLRQTMAKVWGKSLKTINDMLGAGTNKIPGWVFLRAIVWQTSAKNALHEQGKFFKGQEIGAKLIKGSTNRVIDAFQVFRANLGFYVAAQTKYSARAVKLQATIRHINNNFAAFIKQYGRLLKIVAETLVVWTALIAISFVWGFLLRGLGVIVGAWTIITKAATLATWLWNSALIRTAAGGMVALLMKIPLLRNALVGLTFLFEGAGLGAAFLDFMLVAIPVIIGLIAYGIYRLLRHFKLLHPVLKGMGWLFREEIEKPLEAIWHVLKKVISELTKLSKVGFHGLEHVGSWMGAKIPLLPASVRADIGHVMPTRAGMVTALSTAGSLVSAFKEAFPALNEGLKPQITVNVNGTKVLAPEHAGHFGGAYHVDLGLNMPLSGA